MQIGAIQAWLNVGTSVLALLAILVGALWAYTKFILERGYLPPVEFTVDSKVLGKQSGRYIVEILLHLKNIGTSTLIAQNIEARIRYIEGAEEVNLLADVADAKFGHMNFPHTLSRAIGENRASGRSTIPIVPHNTFVQPKVDQVYTLVTALPQSATYMLVWAQFRYEPRPSRLERFAVKVSRRLGLLQYSLDHVNEPHTVERAFNLAVDGDSDQ